ncbi:MAG: hypothetical protein Q9M94_04485 [Candidatus Gracilibacteria bacterium]|nr:hypothetical protein [Candidatus Gracilibacteria bacterium]MDQ7022100.1 hypothetical protein [Candidatus Gracilibacteria bacterium]
MQVKIFGEGEKTKELLLKVKNVLDELGLVDFIKVEETSDESLKNELGIKETPALIIEEESIDFKDIIFEGTIPGDEELKSMFTSIIGGGDTGGSCGSTEADGSCGTGCAC